MSSGFTLCLLGVKSGVLVVKKICGNHAQVRAAVIALGARALSAVAGALV